MISGKVLLTAMFLMLIFSLSAGDNVYRLLIIDSQDSEPYLSVRESMLAELNRSGYVVNKNLVIVYYSLANHVGAARNVFRKEKDNEYDVIFVNGTVAAEGMRNQVMGNDKYKVVFASVTDPVGLGIIDNFEESPKANFTGVCYPVKIEERLRFIRKVMPNVKNIGLIYSEMPQSLSYVEWIKESHELPDFMDLNFVFRKVEFVKSELGYIRMTQLAEDHVKEIDSEVDIYISPNDQMGVQRTFAEMVYKTSTKPLLGQGRKDVMEDWGAAFSIYPCLTGAGVQAAKMIDRLFRGEDIKDIIPEWPPVGTAFDLKKLAEWNIHPSQELIEEAEGDVVE